MSVHGLYLDGYDRYPPNPSVMYNIVNEVHYIIYIHTVLVCSEQQTAVKTHATVLHMYRNRIHVAYRTAHIYVIIARRKAHFDSVYAKNRTK